MQRVSSIVAAMTAAMAVLLGAVGLAFADANKQGCGTRLRTFDTVPPTRTVACSQLGCLNICTQIELLDGAIICSCDGLSTNPASYYDPDGQGAQTKCVSTIVEVPGRLALSCKRGSCAQPCTVHGQSFPADPGPPLIPSGNDAWCLCE